jgi:uncharacterized lipoprotein YajG
MIVITRRIFCLVLVSFPLVACGTTAVTLKYDPANVQQAAASAQQSIAIAAVTDKRKHDPNWLGAIRGGFGNPLKTLETSMPVKDLVAAAYADGLKARGLLASDTPRYDMRVIVNQYDSNQYVRREAHIRFAVTVVDKTSGKELFADNIAVDKVAGSLIALDAGIFAEVEDLRLLANQALQEAVDKTLNDADFVAKLK